VNFYCESGDLPTWFFTPSKSSGQVDSQDKKLLVNPKPIHLGKLLEISEVQVQDDGFYICVGKYQPNSLNTFINRVGLVVYGEYKVVRNVQCY